MDHDIMLKELPDLCFEELSQGDVGLILYAIEHGFFEPDNDWMQRAYKAYLTDGYKTHIQSQSKQRENLTDGGNWYFKIFMMSHSTGIKPGEEAHRRIEEIKKEVETDYPGLHDLIMQKGYYDRTIS